MVRGLTAVLLGLAAVASQGQPAPAALDEIYRHLHQNPELSRQEEKTAAYVATELRRMGFAVTEHVGRYADGAQAAGVVAVLENGAGPRLLLRTELDALPVEEKTGLEFSSHTRGVNAQGQPVGVMHACGHDLHMTALLGAARELVRRKAEWHGTLMVVGQPAEEIVEGARAMLADHLYERFGRPDFVVAEHDMNGLEAGRVALKPGPLMASSTGLTLVVRGIGGHGSQPQAGKDPITLAAEFVVVAQTIVSRQIDPQQPAVLSVGMIHGGTKNNIIPDEVALGMTLRTFSMAERDQIVAAVRRTAEGLAAAYGVPTDRMPTLTVDEGAPVLINDAALAARLRLALESALGKENVETAAQVMASEDFGLFNQDGKIPDLMLWLGADAPEKLAAAHAAGKNTPGLHSSTFAPDVERAIPTGVKTMTAVAMELLR